MSDDGAPVVDIFSTNLSMENNITTLLAKLVTFAHRIDVSWTEYTRRNNPTESLRRSGLTKPRQVTKAAKKKAAKKKATKKKRGPQASHAPPSEHARARAIVEIIERTGRKNRHLCANLEPLRPQCPPPVQYRAPEVDESPPRRSGKRGCGQAESQHMANKRRRTGPASAVTAVVARTTTISIYTTTNHVRSISVAIRFKRRSRREEAARNPSNKVEDAYRDAAWRQRKSLHSFLYCYYDSNTYLCVYRSRDALGGVEPT